MAKGESDPVDVHIGQRIKLGRTQRHLTQSQLGDRIGVSVQQVQKYEAAKDRVSAAKLKQISDALRLPVAFFVDADVTDTLDGLDDQARAFAETLASISDATVRRRVLLFVQSLRDDLAAAEVRIRAEVRAEYEARKP